MTTPRKFKAPESSDKEDDRKPKSPGLGQTMSQTEGGSFNPFAPIVSKPQITTPRHFFSEEPTPTQWNPTPIPEDLLALELVEYLKKNQPKDTDTYETADEGFPPLPESPKISSNTPSEHESDISMSTQGTQEALKTNDKELRLNPPTPFEGDKKKSKKWL
ncbi:hypothetical protein BDQ17DRAFT_1430905 [Cyathus striatus]|nr:hypothetical protein BDQ17DRAFT_1430905 [Cyathus striatus]